MAKDKIAGIAIICFLALIVGIGISIENTEKNTVTNISKCDTVPAEVIRVVEFGYNGHDYIEFVTRGGHCTVVHSPECHCLDDAKEIIDQMQTEYYD